MERRRLSGLQADGDVAQTDRGYQGRGLDTMSSPNGSVDPWNPNGFVCMHRTSDQMQGPMSGNGWAFTFTSAPLFPIWRATNPNCPMGVDVRHGRATRLMYHRDRVLA